MAILDSLLFAAVLVAFLDLKLYDLGVWLLVAALLLLSYILLSRRKRKPPLAPERAKFRVSRPERVRAAQQALRADRVLILAGDSGVGKSVLAKEIEEAMTAGNDMQSIDRRNYGAEEEAQPLAEVMASNKDKNTLWVLDQLEKIFLLEPKEAKQQIDCVRGIVSSSRQENSTWRCLLVIRREWFLNLVLLDEVKALASKVQGVVGFDQKAEEDSYKWFRKRLGALLDDKKLVEAVIADTRRIARTDKVTPVTALAAVDALRFLRGSQTQSYEKLGGFRGVMRSYFQAFLDASGSPDDAARVLAALSVEGTRRALSDREVSAATCLPLGTARSLLEFFASKELLQRVEKKYDWVHDFFAENFNDLSGSFLKPAERDNIKNFWERFGGGREAQSKVMKVNERGVVWSYWLFVISAALLWGRTLMLPVVKGQAEGFFFSALLPPVDFLPATVVDLSFVPVALCLTAWAWYTTALQRRVFCRMEESRGACWLSWIVTVTSTLLVCLSVVFPRWWVALTGVGGLLVGVKYLQAGHRMGTGLRKQHFFGYGGLFTCIYCLIMLAFGIFVYARFMGGEFGEFDTTVSTSFTWAVTFVMLLFAIAVIVQHIKKDVAASTVSTYRRYTMA